MATKTKKTVKKEEHKTPDADISSVRTGQGGISLNFRIPRDVDRLLFALQIDRRSDEKYPIRSRSQACLVAIMHGLKDLGYINLDQAEQIIKADRQIKLVDKTRVLPE